jgi:hypothetical protein
MSDVLSIKITKGRDGPAVLTCTRPDGTSTWARVSEYFPTHDLTHFVVESTLRVPNAFYSLILDGWDLGDFTTKGASKTVPPQANLVEALVGRLQRDLMADSDFTAATYNEEVAAVLDGIGNPERRPVTEDELEIMRARLRELLDQWVELSPGESLRLIFPRLDR